MRLVIAGGGTGGHLFPAVSVAETLMEEEGNDVLFIGTEHGIEKRVVPSLGFKLELIESSGIKGKGMAGKVKSMAKIPVGMYQSLKIIKEYKPDCILGVGGYASAPAVFAGVLLKVPTAIHEQNTIPGLANKVSGKFVDRVFVSFEMTKRFFSEKQVMSTGNPVRSSFLKSLATTKVEKERKFTLLVFGGSRGAHRINQSLMESLDRLECIKDDLKIIHQTGEDDFETAVKGHREKGFDSECLKFIDNMVQAYKKADLVLCRAGASSLAEIAILGLPSILVPYPYASYNHQEFNAREFAACGGAEMILNSALNGETVAERVLHFYKNRNLLSDMGVKVKKLGKPYASSEVIKGLKGLINV